MKSREEPQNAALKGVAVLPAAGFPGLGLWRKALIFFPRLALLWPAPCGAAPLPAPVRAAAGRSGGLTENSRKYLLWSYLALAFLGIAVFRYFGQQLLGLLPSAVTRDHPFSLGTALIMAGFVVLLAGGVLFSAPTNPLFYLAAGYFFGPVNGTVLALLATLLGSGCAFRFFGKTITLPAAASRLEVKRVFFVLALLRCSPWVPSSLINLFCGVTRVPWTVFLSSTLLGTAPLILVYTLTASRFKGPLAMSMLYSPEIIAAVSLLGLLSLLGFLQPLRAVMGYLRGLAFP